jgi:hypothetical protein
MHEEMVRLWTTGIVVMDEVRYVMVWIWRDVTTETLRLVLAQLGAAGEVVGPPPCCEVGVLPPPGVVDGGEYSGGG